MSGWPSPPPQNPSSSLLGQRPSTTFGAVASPLLRQTNMVGTAAPAPPLPSAPTAPPAVPEKYMHQNRLQEFAQRNHGRVLRYHVDDEGQPHKCTFKCRVQVGNEWFSSDQSYSCPEDAEQDAASVAYEILMKRVESSDPIDAFELIDQDFLQEMSPKDEKIASLMNMGFPKDQAKMAITRCGLDASVAVLIDSIYASQTTESGLSGSLSDLE